MPHPHVNGTGTFEAPTTTSIPRPTRAQFRESEARSKALADEVSKLAARNAAQEKQITALRDQVSGARNEAAMKAFDASAERRKHVAELSASRVRQKNGWARALKVTARSIAEDAARFGEEDIGIAALALEQAADHVLVSTDVTLLAARVPA